MQRITWTGVALASLALACNSGPKKSGPAVAKGNGIVITADEFKARLDEQSPFIRQRYSTLERKKEFLDNLIRFEVLARAAEKQGLAKDPDVLLTLKKVMVQKLVQKTFQEGDAAKEISDADARKYYDEHKDEYVKARRVRLSQVFFAAPAGAKDRAQKGAAAKKALQRVQAEEKKNTLAFPTVARALSEDAATKASGGDLGFKSEAELAPQYGKPFSDRIFEMKDNEVALLESAQGFHVVKRTGYQEAIERPFEAVKAQIQNRLYREKRTKDFDAYVKKLRDEADVKIDDAVLEKVQVSAAPPGGMFPGAMAPGSPHGGAPMPGAPSARPVTAPPGGPSPHPVAPAPAKP